MTRTEAVRLMTHRPVKIGHMLGFKDLTDLHNEWIRDMVTGKGDRLLQSHRNSYKTTCVSIALAELMILIRAIQSDCIKKMIQAVKVIKLEA